MKILGVTNTPDSGAALIVDGRIVAAANEERFTRVKLTKEFPTKSIEYVLSTAGLSISDIDWVGCGCWKGIATWRLTARLPPSEWAASTTNGC